MQFTLNGEEALLEGTRTVGELLRRHQLAPERVAIEVNERLVRRAEFDDTPIRAGDRVEVVTLVGGG